MSRYDVALSTNRNNKNEFENKLQEYEATREFAMNFDERKLPSQKIRLGDHVLYDGVTATYTKPNGEKITGAVSSLRSVIIKAKWLVLVSSAKKSKKDAEMDTAVAETLATPVRPASSDFDPKRGGNFNTFMHADENTKVTKLGTVIREDDRVVKRFSTQTQPEQKSVAPKLEVARDQVQVKDRIIVSSSTSGPREAKRTPTIIRDDSSTVGISPISMRKKEASKPGKKTFIVDQTTPSVRDDATLTEIRRATEVIPAESQEAQIVGKVSRRAEVQETEGITFRRTKTASEMTTKVTVSAGSTPIGGAGDGVEVAKTHKPEELDAVERDKMIKRAEAQKTAAARAAERKQKSATTQAVVEKNKPTKAEVKVLAEAVDTALSDPDGSVTITKTEDSLFDNEDYLSKLPPDWGKLHWVQREKFIKSLTDIEFIKFILSVEDVKAVKNACEERLKELTK